MNIVPPPLASLGITEEAEEIVEKQKKVIMRK